MTCSLARPADQATLLASLAGIAVRQPSRIALIQGEVEVTYGELVARVAGAAAGLREAGMRTGDRVLLSAVNSPAIPILYFAIHAVGGVAVLVAPETPPDAIAAIAAQAEAGLALLDRPLDTLDCPALVASEVAARIAAADFVFPPASATADLLFTSGTTGKKKGVMLSHANTVAAARNISAFLGVRSDDIQTVPLPLSHSFGLGCVRSMAWAGHTLLIERGLVNPAAMLKRMARRGATGLAIVPSGVDVMRRMTGDSLGELRGSLRFVELGSAPIAAEARSWLMDMLPTTRLCHHYGMTEASRAAFTEYHADAHKVGSVGQASPNVTITILDEARAPAPVGQTGEIAVSGDVVMSGYWRDAELSAARIGPHGLATGDVGRMDADGHLYLLGRRDDIINVGGRKVVPDEVEELLRSHPAISDVVCVGVPDPVLGQSVKAYLVRETPIDDAALLAWLKPRLEDYKTPRAFEDIAAVPRTDSGKVQRQMVKN